MTIKLSWEKIKNFILTFFVIYISDDTLLFGSNGNQQIISMRNYIYIGFMVILLVVLFNEVRAISKKELTFVSLIITCIVCSAIVNNDLRTGTIYLVVLFLLCFCITKLLPFDEFAGFFVKIIEVISAASILLFAIYILARGKLEIFPTVTNSAGNSYYFAGLASMGKEYYQGFARNQGIFREPGVFVAYLILALVIELFYFKRIKYFNLIVLLIAIATTFSTTGYIAFFAVIVAFFVSDSESFKNYRNLKMGLMFILGIGIIMLAVNTDYLSMEGPIFSKLFNKSNASTSARLASVLVNLAFISKHPIFGVGLTYLNLNFSSYATLVLNMSYTTHNTNTMLFQFALNGIPYGLLICTLYWKFCSIFAKNKMWTVYGILIMLILFSGENYVFSIMNYLIMMYGLTYSLDACDRPYID